MSRNASYPDDKLAPEVVPMLEPVGISSDEESLFRLLLDRPRATVAELAMAARSTTTATAELLGGIEARGLAVRMRGNPVRYVPAVPELAIEQLVLRRQEELEQVRAIARELTAQFRQRIDTRPEIVAEVITGREAVANALRQVKLTARSSLLVTDRPPYVEAGRPAFSAEELDVLGRGVSCRRIYHRPTLDLPDHVTHMQRYLDAGEQARVLTDVPLKMLVVDGTRALVPLESDQPTYDVTVLVYARPLVDALVFCFEALWERAVPVQPQPGGGQEGRERSAGWPDAQVRRLLTLLASGLKDEAVARQMGLSSRTVVRRVDRLMKVLGADTRFQAGLQAVRRGWL